MLRKVRKLGALLLALTMIFVLALGTGAAYYKTPTSLDIDGTVVGSITDSSLTASISIAPGSAKSINYHLEGDALTSEFWNNSDAYVEVDVTLNTDGDQVYACMPGFTANWGWVNPSDWNGLLVNGQTTTVREPFSTYYSGGFNSKEPMAFRVQLYTNSTETQDIEITVSAPRFVGVGDAPEVTTTVATTTTPEPEETTTAPVEEDEPVDEPADTEEPVDTEDEPEETTTAATTTTAKTEEEDSDRPVTTTTQPNQTTTPAASTAATTTASSDVGGDSFAGPIVIIVIVVVVIAAAAVGFIIYRKKKFY